MTKSYGDWRFIFRLLVLVTFLGVIRTNAQDITVVTINHAQKKIANVNVDKNRHSSLLDKKITLYSSKDIKIKIDNTNTAFYDYKISTEEFDAPEVKQLQTFFKAFKPYLLDIRNYLVSKEPVEEKGIKFYIEKTLLPQSPINIWKGEADTLYNILKKINDLLFYNPKSSIRAVQLKALQTIQNMNVGGDVEKEAKKIDDNLKDCFNYHKKEPKEFKTISQIIDSYTRLNDFIGKLKGSQDERDSIKKENEKEKGKLNKDLIAKSEQLKKAAKEKRENIQKEIDVLSNSIETKNKDQSALEFIDKVLAEGEKAIADNKKVLEDAYKVESVVISLMTAESTKVTPIEKTSLEKGKTITLKITPSKALTFSSIEKDELEFKISVSPDWKIRPSAGLSLIYWTGDRFNKYLTVKENNKEKIVESSDQEPGLFYGLSLGLTYPGLDWRDFDGHGLTVWFPEIVLNPSTTDFKLKAAGLGIAVSYSSFKVSAGCVWIKGTVLDGQHADQVLENNEVLKTKDSFSPRWYLSVSYSIWLPFAEN